MSFNKDCLPLFCSVFLNQGVFYCSRARCFCHICAALTFRDSGAKIIFLSPLDISTHIFAIPRISFSGVNILIMLLGVILDLNVLHIQHYFQILHLPIFLGCTDLPRNSSWFPDWCVSGSSTSIVSFLQQFFWWFICYHVLPLLPSSLHIVVAFHACSQFPVL